MNSFPNAHLVVAAAGERSDRFLVHAICRMGLSGVRIVSALDPARRLCESGTVDACLVIIPRAVPDEVPQLKVETPAPGRGTGVPSLLFADVVTPYLAKAARRSGYLAVIPIGIAPRLLYRCIGALLQEARRSAERTAGRQGAGAVLRPVRIDRLDTADDTVDAGKLKLQ